MKYLLLIVIVGVVLWLMRSRSREPRAGAPGPARGARRQGGGPVTMLACVHCGVHLPQSDAVRDGEDRPYCSEAHRLAGPR